MKSIILLFAIFIITSSVSSFAQKSGKKYYITGQVLDINNKPVSGAIVLIDNKSSDVITDDKGMYKVKIKADAAIISILNLSSGLMNEVINGRIVINFKLNNIVPQEETMKQENPDNEIVNIGYGYARKKDLATSVGHINGQNTKYASYQNVYEMIRGEIPGVQVAGKKITIRGIGTINASSDPMVLVDGVDVLLNDNNTLDAIDPRLVKSIDILKGSDAAIYGSRAANGVILITLIGR
jgi:TonB-dependent SusC/RagA subfamily outer membrane receptor